MEAKSRKEIAAEMGISYKTLLRFIQSKNISLTNRRLLTPSEYTLIYEKFYSSREDWPKNNK